MDGLPSLSSFSILWLPVFLSRSRVETIQLKESRGRRSWELAKVYVTLGTANNRIWRSTWTRKHRLGPGVPDSAPQHMTLNSSLLGWEPPCP